MWKKDEGESEKTARGAGLYTFEKAAGEAMPGALPEEATPNPKGPRSAWKQERAGISPGRRLFFINYIYFLIIEICETYIRLKTKLLFILIEVKEVNLSVKKDINQKNYR